MTRIRIGAEAHGPYDAMAAFDRSIDVDSRLGELIKIRASQINGCAYCIDMHTYQARRGGETDRRMHALAAWHESHLFSPRERAALALTDAITRISDGGVPDDVYETAAGQFNGPELAHVVMAIVAINAWNRIAVSTRATYEPPRDDASVV